MARAGRKRKNGPREPSGRLSRRVEARKERDDMTEREAKAVAIDARIRHGVPVELADLVDAGRPNVGTVHGCMRLRGMQKPGGTDSLDADQYAAAEWYLGEWARHLRGIGAPGRTREAPEHSTGVGGVGLSEAIDAWQRVVDCLQAVATTTRLPVLSAFDVVLVRQCFLPHLVLPLRCGLDAVHREFLAGQRRAA